MVQIRAVRTYGNPADSPGQTESPKLPQGPQVLQPGQQETLFRGYQPSDSTIVRDRHAILNRGSENTGRATDQGDPMKDGPPRASIRLINRTFNPQIGSDNTRNQDDLHRGYRQEPTGQWAGSQDGSTSMIWGGTPGLYTPYGSYGGYTRGPVQGIQGVPIGQPGDGPQVIPNSPPHGLHSATFADRKQTNDRFAANRQQKAGRVDRPSNSPIAGQSFSQTVIFQGQTRQLPVNFTEGKVRSLSPLGGGAWRGQ